MIAPRKSYLGPALLFGGGAVALGVGVFAFRKASATTDGVAAALAGTDPPATAAPAAPGTGGVVAVHTTGYWPFTARDDEKKMEGGTKDRKGKPLYTLEMHLKDPASCPYVSVSGDDAVWPYGQRLSISAWPNAIFRVVDTGGHFRGAGKVYRVLGEEPLDICVDSSKTPVPKSGVTAKIFPGDNFAKGTPDVAVAKIKNQTVVSGEVSSFEEVHSEDDREALARALESELGGRSTEELIGAAWAIRNRAAHADISIHGLLAPHGEYGSARRSGGYASTRQPATPRARAVVSTILGAPALFDPTGGAIDFWVPAQQAKLRALGDVYRAAVKSGDETKIARYAKYANYGRESDVRAQQERGGLRITNIIGAVELLGKA